MLYVSLALDVFVTYLVSYCIEVNDSEGHN
jgi:hypothetical protein